MFKPGLAVDSLSTVKFHTDELHFFTVECLQFIEITDSIAEIVAASGVEFGMVNIQTRHTTTAIIINENESLLLDDMRRTLERVAPRYEAYRHDDFSVRTENMTSDENPNGHAHCKALFLRSSESVNIVDGQLQLGRWQRIFLLELDCARPRTVSVMVIGQ